MEKWQKEKIQSNLVQLIRDTICHAALLSKFEQSKILHRQDVEVLQLLMLTEMEKSKKLYETLMTRTGAYDVLLEALEETSQTGALHILTENNSLFRKYGHITYDKNHVLGSGSLGTKVYKGTYGGRSVAVKLLNSNMVDPEVAEREVKLLEKLDSHENILRYYSAEVTENFLCIALELCICTVEDQVNLKLLHMPSTEILYQCTYGLTHLHNNNVIHRDLKPANILLTLDKKVKISDFGLSKQIPLGASRVSVSGAVGTADWIAPEILTAFLQRTSSPNSTTMTTRSDIFSLGCIFHFVLTDGVHPFGDELERNFYIAKGRPQLMPELVEANWLQLIKAMISHNPNDRPSADIIISTKLPRLKKFDAASQAKPSVPTAPTFMAPQRHPQKTIHPDKKSQGQDFELPTSEEIINFSLPDSMLRWQKEYFTSHGRTLVETTKCDDELLASLRNAGLISKDSAEKLGAIGNQIEASKMLYNILLTTTKGYPELAKAIYDGKQFEAAHILLKGFPKQGIRNPLKLCSIPIEFERILESTVEFQGRYCKLCDIWKGFGVSDLEEIMSKGQYDKEYIELFISGGREHFVLAVDNIPRAPAFYIPRFISNRLLLNQMIFYQDCPDVFVFKGIGRADLQDVAGRFGASTSSNQLLELNCRFIGLECDEDWETIRKISGRPAHLVRFLQRRWDSISAPNYILEDTTGNSKILQQYIYKDHPDDKVFITEDEFIAKIGAEEHSDNVCIWDLPGMGKSFLLENVARKIHRKFPERIAVFIHLNQFTRIMKQQHDIDELTEAKSLDMVLSQISTSPLSKSILCKALAKEYTKLDIFLDGYDEVPVENFEWTCRFIHTFRQNSKLYATSAPNASRDSYFQNYSTLPFTQQNQLDFLVQAWQHNFSEVDISKLKQFASICLRKFQKSLTLPEREMIPVPLYCHLLSQVYRKEARSYSNSGTKQDIPLLPPVSIYHMFRNFFEERFPTNFKSGRQSNEVLENSKLKRYHIWSALKLVSPTVAEAYANHYQVDTNRPNDVTLGFGILKVQTDANISAAEFIHQTFAKFLVAEYFVGVLLSQGDHDNDPKELTMQLVDCFTKRIARCNESVKVDLDYTVHAGYYHSIFADPILIYFVHETMRSIKNGSVNPTVSKVVLDSVKPDRLFEILQCAASQSCLEIIRFLKEILQSWSETELKCYKDFLLNKSVTSRSWNKEKMEPVSLLLCIAAKDSTVAVVDEIFQLFRECFRCDVDNICGRMTKDTITPLQHAIEKVDYELVEYLVDKFSLDGRTLLYHCIEKSYGESSEITKRRMEICTLLLSKNINLLFEEGYYGRSKCTGPLVSRKVSLELIKFLIREGADVRANSTENDQEQTLVHRAAECMHPADFQELCRFLIHDCQLIDLFKSCSDRQNYPLHFILRWHKVTPGFVSMLLKETESDANGVNDDGDNFLFAAARGNNSVDVVKELVTLGVSLEYKDGEGKTILHLVAELGNMDIMKYLATLGLSLNDRDLKGNTPLLLAYDNLEMVKFLVGHGADMLAVDEDGHTVSNISAGNSNDKTHFHKLVAFLLEQDNTGAVFKLKNTWGVSTLHQRIRGDHKEIDGQTVDLLLSFSGAEICPKDTFEDNLFHLAIRMNRSTDVIKAFVDGGADYKAVDRCGDNSLKMAEGFNAQCVEYLKTLDWSN